MRTTSLRAYARRVPIVQTTVLLIVLFALVVAGGHYAVPTHAETRLIPPLASVVPPGKAVAVEVTGSHDEHLASYLVRPRERRAVHLIRNPGESSRPYAAIVVYDEDGLSELGGTTLEIHRSEQDAYGRIEPKLNGLSGHEVKVVGGQTVQGVETTVVQGTRRLPETDIALQVKGFVDDRGVVIREETTGEKGGGLVITREVIDPAAHEFGDLSRQNLQELASEMLAGRIAALSRRSYEVPALPEGLHDLSLMWVMPDDEGNYVRLEYQASDSPHRPAAAIEVWNLDARSDYPADLLASLSAARVEDLGSARRITFRWSKNTAVQILTEKEFTSVSPKTLAGELVPIEH